MRTILGSRIQPVEQKKKNTAACSRCGLVRSVHQGALSRGSLCFSCRSSMSKEEVAQWESQ